MADNSIGPVEVEFAIPDKVAQDFDMLIKKMTDVSTESASMGKTISAEMEGVSSSVENTAMKMNETSQIGRRHFEIMSLAANMSAKDVANVGEQAESTAANLAEMGQVSSNAFQKTAAGAESTAKSLGSAHGGANRLGFSVQQIARELPAASVGLGTFFLAISNNIPMLQEELQRTRNEVELMKASGQKVTPVWKQLFSSIFSWQTALMVGVTMLTMYGKEIANWTTSLFSHKKAVEEDAKAIEAFNTKTAEGMSKSMATIESLSQQWSKLGDNLKEKKKFVEDNKDAFHDLGVEVKNVSDAENLLSSQKSIEAFKTAIAEKAKAAAAMDIAAEKYKDGMKKMMEADNVKVNSPSFTDKAKSLFLQMGQGEDPNAKLNDPELSAKAMAGKRKTELRKAAQEDYDAAKNYVKQSISSQEEADKALESLGVKKYEKELKQHKAHEKKIYDAKKELQQLLLDIDAETAKQQIEQMDDTLQKRLAKIDEEKEQEKRKITEKNDAIIKAYNENKGLKGDKAITDISQIDPVAAQAQKDAIAKLDAAYAARRVFEEQQAAKAVQEIRDELAAKQKSALDQELADIDKYYDDLIEKARKYGGDVAAVSNAARDTAKAAAIGNSLLDQLGMDEDIAKKRQELANKSFLFQADKEKQLLLIVKKFAEERLATYKTKQTGGVKGLEGQIAGLETGIKSTTDDISNAPWKKLSEASGYADQLAGALSGVSKEASVVVSGAAGIGSSIAQMATPGGQISGAIGMMTTLISLGSSLFGGETTEERQKEFIDSINSYVDQLNKNLEHTASLIDEAFGEKKSKAYLQYMRDVATTTDLSVGKISTDFQSFINDMDGKLTGSAMIEKVRNKITGLSVMLSKLSETTSTPGDVFGLKESLGYISEMGSAIDDLYEYKNKYYETMSETGRTTLDNTISQLEEQADALKQATNDYEEYLTGTTSSSITDSIVEGFKNGYSSAADFADNFGSLMQAAILQALKTKMLDSQMQDWYDQFAAANESDGALTKDEIEALKTYYNKIITDAQNEFDAMKQATGVDFSTSDSTSTTRSGLSGSVAQASQESVDLLSGRILGMQAMVAEMRSISQERKIVENIMRGHLQAIEQNTAYCRYLETIDGKLGNIENNGVKVKL